MPERRFDFAPPLSELAKGPPNTITPAPGQGLTLDPAGKIPLTVLTPGSTGQTIVTSGGIAVWAAPGSPTLTTVEVSLVAAPDARHNGSFQINGLTGLTTGKPVFVTQANGPYTGKGTRQDEAEVDQVRVSAQVLNATTIQCYWQSQYQVRGNYKFVYFIGA